MGLKEDSKDSSNMVAALKGKMNSSLAQNADDISSMSSVNSSVNLNLNPSIKLVGGMEDFDS